MKTRRALLGGLLAIGVGAALLALWAALGSAEDEVLPPAWRWPLAAVLAVVWLATAAAAWVVLFDVDTADERRALTGALLLSQLGKYVPGGGIVQVTGMVAMSRSERLGAGRLALGVPVIGLSVVAIGGVATAGLSVADTSLPAWARVVCLAGIMAPAVLWRPLMATVLSGIRRLVKRIPAPDALPSQRAILVSTAFTTVSLAATSLGYAVLVQPLRDERDLVSLALVFVVAWTAGFLVLPVPGGLGIREVVLVGLIGGAAASIVGAAIAHRVINIAVELVAVAGWLVTNRRRSNSASE